VHSEAGSRFGPDLGAAVREYLWRVVPVSFHDFFGASATVAGALIGLLFVAISISPAKLSGSSADAGHQIKAATAFSALVNTLVIALVTLLPGASLSVTVIVVAAGGLSSTAGLTILLFRDSKMRVPLDQLILPVALLVLYGLQLAVGIRLGRSPGNLGLISSLGGLCIGFFAFAIARAWALVGARGSSLLTTVVGMARRPGDPDTTPAPSDKAKEVASSPSQENPG
jgi:hypothetical protein